MADWLRAGLLWTMLLCLGTEQATKQHRCPVVSNLSVSYLSRVSIPCPSITCSSEEVKYHLYLNSSLLHTVQFDEEELCGSGVCIQFSRGQNRTSRFEVTANHTGLYTCKREEVYPPPHKEDCRDTVVVVQEKSSRRVAYQIPELNQNLLLANQSCSKGSPSVLESVLWAGCGVLLVYSLTITCITIVIWRKLKTEEESESEYVNTKPGECRRPYKV